jgi:hypothetical protein
MAYTIIKSDGTVLTTIPNGQINTTSTSLGLPGRNYPGWGQPYVTNFTHLTENFASPNPPPNPIRGQLWYNTNNQTMNICPSDGETVANNWISLQSISGNGTTTFGSITVLGNITAGGNIFANSGNISVSDVSTSTLSVAATANIATLTTRNITTGGNTVTGNLTGNWTLTSGSKLLGLTNIPSGNLSGVDGNTSNILFGNGVFGPGGAGSAGATGATGAQGPAGVGIVNSGNATYVAFYATGGTTLSSGQGQTVYAGDFATASDIALKNVEGNIEDSLSKILSLRGIRYTWNDAAQNMGFAKNQKQIGVVADDIEKILPELIKYDNDGYKLVSYDRLVPVLIEAIKELYNKIEKK